MISIVIPALNEPLLDDLINDISIDLSRNNILFEIIIRDDKGCGNAILTGIRKAKYPIVLVMDGDGSHSPVYIKQLYRKLKHDNDIVYGRKKVSYDSWYRKIVTWVFDILARIYIADYPDLMSGFFIFKKDKVIDCLPETLNHPKVLMYIVKHKKNLNIDYVNIIFSKRKAGESKLGKIEVALLILKEMISK